MITVKVPATTANLGSGFDCIGTALSLYNTVKVSPNAEGKLEIKVTGLDAHRVSVHEDNLLYQAFALVYQRLDRPVPPVTLEIDIDIPLARGLGSSATAIVAGLVGANAFAGFPFSPPEIIHLAIEMEGHPDNVVPAFLGHCQLSVGKNGQWHICPIAWHPQIIPIVAIPDFELSTEEARSVLPQHYSRADAIFNTAHFGLLIRGLETHQADWLSTALDDRIHQPYRKHLIRGFDRVHRGALEAGAYGMVISGAGPTLLSLSPASMVDQVVRAMAETWLEEGVHAVVKAVTIDTQGAMVFEE